jgi:hypothetical protein
MNANLLRNLCLGKSYFQKTINEVSLFIGKLRVTHREACLWLSAPLTMVVKRALLYFSLPFNHHLCCTCELNPRHKKGEIKFYNSLDHESENVNIEV